MVSLPTELAQQVEDYRFRLRLKTEAEAIRRLIEAGLKAEALSEHLERVSSEKRDA